MMLNSACRTPHPLPTFMVTVTNAEKIIRAFRISLAIFSENTSLQ
jgi:hypothetical protein